MRLRNVCIAALIMFICVCEVRAAGLSDEQQRMEDAQSAPYQLFLEDVEKAVSDALVAAKIAPYIRATMINNRDKILYSGQREAHVELRTLRYDTTRYSWSANMLIMDGDKTITAKPISGRYYEQKELPVLNKRVLNGNVITKGDVVMQLFPVTKARQDTVNEREALIGKSPRHMISPNRPVRTAELTSPAVLKKGATVTMRYATAYMDITTTGEAQEEGTIGDVIRVRNTDSNKIVRAAITSAQEVLVGSGH